MPRIRWFVIWGPWWTASIVRGLRRASLAPRRSLRSLSAQLAINDRTKMSINQGPRGAGRPRFVADSVVAEMQAQLDAPSVGAIAVAPTRAEARRSLAAENEARMRLVTVAKSNGSKMVDELVASRGDCARRRSPTRSSSSARGTERAAHKIGVSSSVLVHRGRRATFERGEAGGAQRFGRHEPNAALAANTGLLDAVALDILKEGLLFRSVDIPKAEIVVEGGGHFKQFPLLPADEAVLDHARESPTIGRR